MAKVLLIVGFVISFGAGWIMSVGFERRQQQRQEQGQVTPPTTQPSRRGGFLTSELNLTPDQQEQMKKIWSDVAHHGGREQGDRRNQFRKERDEAIAGLIRPEDKEKYERALKAYAERNAELEKEMRSSYQSAVDRTKEMLTPEQRRKYEEFQKTHEPPRGPREHEQGRRVEDRATSRPGSEK